MAIVDIGQSVPSHGPPKMTQGPAAVVHQSSSNQTIHSTTMGTSSVKSKKSPSSITSKRHQPLDVYVQNKKRNLATDSINLSEKYGINKNEITLVPLPCISSQKSHNVNMDKSPVKSVLMEVTDERNSETLSSNHSIKSCNEDIPSECIDMVQSNEISIVKVTSKKLANSREKKEIEWNSNNMISLNTELDINCKKEKFCDLDDIDKEFNTKEEMQTEEDHSDETAANFWNKRSAGKDRLYKASTYLQEPSSANHSYEHSNDIYNNVNILPSDENWDNENDTSVYLTYQDAPKLNEESWETYDPTSNNQMVIPDHSNYSPDSAYGSLGDSEMPHYMIGFPNPPGENRCWLNATLHTLFATLFSLPIVDDMQQLLHFDKCSKISLMLGDLYELWRKGGSEKIKIYNTVRKFKESLSMIERTYCSDRQQDVSEFLMALLNHLKSEFDKILSKNQINSNLDNVSENVLQTNTSEMNSNHSNKKSQIFEIYNKIPMGKLLFDTSCEGSRIEEQKNIHLNSTNQNSCNTSKTFLSSKINNNNSSENLTDSSNTPLNDNEIVEELNSTSKKLPASPKLDIYNHTSRNSEQNEICDVFSLSLSSSIVNSDLKTDNEFDSSNSEHCDSSESKNLLIENPIDKYFLQKMVEDYVCKKCLKHRQIPIENLMVYADIPPENDISSVDLAEAIQKTFAVEERNLVCEHCKHDTHNMKTFYKEYPKVLTIQINRYGMSNDGMMNKICTAVTIPEKLSLNNFLLEQPDVPKTYEPICIISHVGSNMDCGHYTSYVRHDDQWFHYNDMIVMPMMMKNALTAAQSTAYLLFYVDSDLLDKPSSDCYSSRCSPVH